VCSVYGVLIQAYLDFSFIVCDAFDSSIMLL
jgi:hypothetical protein